MFLPHRLDIYRQTVQNVLGEEQEVLSLFKQNVPCMVSSVYKGVLGNKVAGEYENYDKVIITMNEDIRVGDVLDVTEGQDITRYKVEAISAHYSRITNAIDNLEIYVSAWKQ